MISHRFIAQRQRRCCNTQTVGQHILRSGAVKITAARRRYKSDCLSADADIERVHNFDFERLRQRLTGVAGLAAAGNRRDFFQTNGANRKGNRLRRQRLAVVNDFSLNFILRAGNRPEKWKRFGFAIAIGQHVSGSAAIDAAAALGDGKQNRITGNRFAQGIGNAHDKRFRKTNTCRASRWGARYFCDLTRDGGNQIKDR
ncbi:MAG: hypothetical protein ALAOOOJD_00986 [bacterium]|nr:hypothetical protein [bacterium]